MRTRVVALTAGLALCLGRLEGSQIDPPQPAETQAGLPRLVVLLVVDQMRSDYIDRFRHQWTGGLKRLVDRGARFAEAAYPYLNTVTCSGHATIGTGQFPPRHAIILNEWWDRTAGRRRACTNDPEVTTLTSTGPLPAGHSAVRLQSPTLAEAIAERGGRVVSLSLKARSAIMMAGRRGDMVVWYDDSGTWATSTAYGTEFPAAAAAFMAKRPIEAYRGTSWTKLLSPIRYKGIDDGPYERPTNGWMKTFPHGLDADVSGPGARYYRQWQRTPFADAYLADFAINAIDTMELGRRAGVDFLGLSFSALDSAGHNFGPDSHEVQDVLARLDRTLGRLLAHLDARVGRGRYALALSADHGVAPIPEQSKADGLDAGRLEPAKIAERVSEALVPFLGAGRHVADMNYTNLFFASGVFEKLLENPAAMQTAIATIAAEPGVLRVIRAETLKDAAATGDPVMRAAALSYHPVQSGDLIMIPKPYWIASLDASTHGTMQPYDQRVPVLVYGAGVKGGVYKAAATPADIAPTLARLAGVVFPETDGRPLVEAMVRDETADKKPHD
jgi:predicted AlkP superfamily pyrophosphatase or phosphodiesterase